MTTKTAMIEQRDAWKMDKTGWRAFEFRYTHEMTAKELSELPADIVLHAAVRGIEITPLASYVMVTRDGSLQCSLKDEFVILSPDETVLVHLLSIEKFEREIEHAREMIKAVRLVEFVQAARDARAKRISEE